MLPAVCIAEQESVVLKGVPVIQNKSTVEGSSNITLTKSQQEESKLIITKNGQKYYWATRQNRELTKHVSGIYTIFLDTRGAGYVKAMQSGDKVFYIEHMSLGLETITYWGTADYLRPQSNEYFREPLLRPTP